MSSPSPPPRAARTRARRDARAPRSFLETPTAIACAAAAATVVVLWYILAMYLPAFNTTRSRLTDLAFTPPRFSTTTSVARRLVLMIVDGVSYEAAKTLEDLMPLRRAGVLRPLVVEFPSYTDPAITSLMTGLDPVDSGMRLNGEVTGVPRLDAVTLAAADAGVPVKIRTRGWPAIEALLRARGADVSNSQVRFQAELTAATAAGGWPALPPVKGGGPAREIVIVYIAEADKAAHQHGGASPEFVSAASSAASLVARYARTLDLEQDVLVVVSDHGHLAKGGHGGAEPEILRSFFLAAGSFVRKGVELPERPLRDVASTLSVLGGLRMPTANLGRPMLDIMTLNDDQHSFVLMAPFDQATRLLCELERSPRCAEADPMVRRLFEADAMAWPEAEQLLDEISGNRRTLLTARWLERAGIRLTIAGVIATALAALLFVRRKPPTRELLKAFALTILHASIFAVGMYLLGYSVSFSAMKTQPLFYRDAACASAAAVVISLVVARAFRAGQLAAWVSLLGTFIPVALLAAWVGCDPRDLPPPTEGVLLFEVAPLVLSAGLLATLLAGRARTQ